MSKSPIVAVITRKSVPGKASDYSKQDVEFIKEMLDEGFNLSVGGVKNLIGPGQTIFIKPNLIAPASPENHWTTDPRVIEALIGYLKEAIENITIWIGEGSCGMRGEARRAFNETKVKDAAERAGVDKIIYVDETRQVPVKLPHAKYFYEFNLPAEIFDCDVYLTVPKMKQHAFAQATLALKNGYGLLDFRDTNRSHREDLCQKVVDINLARKPDFCVVDAIVGRACDHMAPCSLQEEHKIEFNSLILGKDPVAVDAVGEYIMGWDRPDEEVRVTRLAQHAGLGEGNLNKIKVKGTDPKSIRKNLLMPLNEKRKQGYAVLPYEYAPVEAVFEGTEVFLGGCCMGCKMLICWVLTGLYRSGSLSRLVEKGERINIIAGRNVSLNPCWTPLPGLTVALGDCAQDWGEKIQGWPGITKFIPGCWPDQIALGTYLGRVVSEMVR